MAVFTEDISLYDMISCFMDFSGIIHEGFYDVYDTDWHYLACLMSFMSPIGFCDNL